MDYRLVYTKPAEHDLEDIVGYIAADDPRAAERVGLALIELAESLVMFPLRGTLLRSRPGVRKVLHDPYLVIYRVDETNRTVRIQRFWHAKRSPHALRTE